MGKPLGVRVSLWALRICCAILKKSMRKILSVWCFCFLAILWIVGLLSLKTRADVIHLALFFPAFLYFFIPKRKKFIKNILAIYSVVLFVVIWVGMIISARSFLDVVWIATFVPVLIFFSLHVGEIMRRWRIGIFTSLKEKKIPVIEVKEQPVVRDEAKRKFLRLVASTGIGVFVLSFFGVKKAQAAFFGSVPGPGVVGMKDSTGTKIDPAIKSPTDGYGIMNVDNASYPGYYGFVNKTGAWYILRENPQNTFLYAKGSSSFSSNWTGRSGLTYASFDTTFSA